MNPPLVYSVLNWGLGHATRSVPIIRILQKMGWDIHLASSGDALQYLSAEFPGLKAIELPDYQVTYPTSWMSINAATFAGSMMRAIQKEQKIIERYAAEYKIQHAISDNRYGCYLKTGKNYFISHQLNIHTGYSISEYVVNRIQARFLKNFHHILVPDFRQMPNLAGKLSRRLDNKPLTYLEVISSYRTPIKKPIKYEWCCILSGIEPQRTRLAEKLFQLLESLKIKSVLLSGKSKPQLTSGNYVEVWPLAGQETVQAIVEESKYLCLRSGYTSIMDLIVWRKPAILIPTPGQPEQEYLARHLMEKFQVTTIAQHDLKPTDFISQPASPENLPGFHRDKLKIELQKLFSLS